jgi:phage-related minor tail protein
MTSANFVITPRIAEVLTVANRLTSAERLFVARWLLDSVLTKEVNDEEDRQQLSLSTLEKEWDNEEDAIYDNWRAHYGVPAR